MRDFLMRFPWPLYPAILAWCVGFILQIIMMKEVDYQKVAQFKITTFGHYLQGRLGTDVLTERGLRLHRWFLVCAGVFLVSLLLAVALYSKHY